MLRQSEELPKNSRILIIRLSALGDIIFGLPVAESIRAQIPKAHITWLVEDRFANLLEGHPDLDEVVVFPRRNKTKILGHLLALRRSGRFDAIIDLQGNLKSAVHLLFARSSRKIGFDRHSAKEGAWRFLSHRINAESRMHRSIRDLKLLEALGLNSDLPARRPWPMTREITQEVSNQLQENKLQPKDFILLHTSFTNYGKDKEWPPEKWAELSQALAAQGQTVRALWTPADLPHVQAIVDASQGSLQLAPPTSSLHHLMALCDQAKFLIGTDSGPIHLASKRGVPVITLFGPTDPVRFSSPGPCSPVSVLGNQEPPPRDRSKRSPLMEQIQVEDVLQAVRAVNL